MVTGDDCGSRNSTVTIATHTTAIQPTGFDQRPRCHGPRWKRPPARSFRKIGIAYAGVIPMTLIAVTAPYAVAEYSDGRARTPATITDSHTAGTGVCVRALTFRQSEEPGSALSRLKANTIRLAAATSAFPQNSCAAITISSIAVAPDVPSASIRICAGGTPVALFCVPT